MTEQDVQKIMYDPSKIYKWNPGDEFVFKGVELQILNEYLSNFVVSNLDVPAILKVAAAKKMVQDIIARNVENGSIVEATQEEVELMMNKTKDEQNTK